MNDFFNDPALKAIRALDDSPAMRAIRAVEDSPAIRMIRELDDSPALRAMRQFENSPAMQAIRQFENSPAIRMMRDLEDSAALKAIKSLEESPAFKAIQQLQEPPVLKALRGYQTSPAMEAFSRIADQVNHGYGALTFSEAYELLADEYEQQTDPEPLNVLSGEVQKRASCAPRSALSAEFYLNLVLALFLFYLSKMSAVESEEKILERFNSLEQTIATQLSNLNELEKDQSFLVADRSMNLRSGPGVDHEVIGGISRNQKLLVLERERDWAKVEYFDHINNKNIAGWAHSRYLLVVSTSGQE
ncbi:SH3 domain-containing protein [Enterovibrio coralii]|uniref:SH3b domain-containing protein n=1 Tax=Enterovibrio coralii TaxID=294935 RepID=A0A135I6B7_9GAMM|nr:SH3 domain-containing protein [Enterovibrio coralii]KXF80988.1 hypothetical protein ATN88_18250 [Enterovibrio coralii]